MSIDYFKKSASKIANYLLKTYSNMVFWRDLKMCPLQKKYNERPLRHIWTLSWWRHQMETFSALLTICAGNSLVTQSPVTRSFNVCDLHPIKGLSKHLWGWWFVTPWRSLWRHCNAILSSNLHANFCFIDEHNINGSALTSYSKSFKPREINHKCFSMILTFYKIYRQAHVMLLEFSLCQWHGMVHYHFDIRHRRLWRSYKVQASKI